MEIQQEIAVGDGVHAVARYAAETKLARHKFAVKRIRQPRQRAAAKRHHIRPRMRLPKALRVAPQHLKVGEQVMREENGLRALHMGIAGHYHSRVGVRLRHKRLSQRVNRAQYAIDSLLGEHPHIERNLVVARARGVELSRGVAYLLKQAALHIHMDVFQLRTPGKCAGFNLFADFGKAALYGARIGGGDNALLGKHPRMRDGAGDVLAIQPAVVVNGYGVGGDDLLHRTRPSFRLAPRDFLLPENAA